MGECIVCLLYSDCYTTIVYDLDSIFVARCRVLKCLQLSEKEVGNFVLFTDCKSQVHALCIQGVSSIYNIYLDR
jgi:hypothetical protein